MENIWQGPETTYKHSSFFPMVGKIHWGSLVVNCFFWDFFWNWDYQTSKSNGNIYKTWVGCWEMFKCVFKPQGTAATLKNLLNTIRFIMIIVFHILVVYVGTSVRSECLARGSTRSCEWLDWEDAVALLLSKQVWGVRPDRKKDGATVWRKAEPLLCEIGSTAQLHLKSENSLKHARK